MKHENTTVALYSPLQLAAAVVRVADGIITALLALVLALVFLIACFSLWDSWRIYQGAGIDQQLLEYKPTLESAGQGDSFEQLLAINPDVSAWITLEGTNIDYPVVQGEDNTFYLNADVYGEFSLSGSIFLDYRNARDFSDPYSLLYGHHMEGEVMFGELEHFLDQEYFQEHTTGLLYLPQETFEIQLFACFQTDAYDSLIFSPDILAQEGTQGLLERVRQEQGQYRELGVSPQDRLLALSTCSDTSTNARTILLGRLQPISYPQGGNGES